MLRVSAATLTAAAALYLGHALIFGPYVADDAAISLAYARNIVRGYGPVLYPGAEAVEGFSNPLWTALIAIGAALRLDGGDGIPLLKTLGLATGLAVVALTAVAPRVVYPEDRGVAWLAPMLLAVWTPFVFWSGAGLENPLYALLLLLAALVQCRELRGEQAGYWSAAALLGAAATRPDGIAFALPFLGHRLVVERSPGRALRWALAVLLPFGALVLVRYLVFDDIVPNTSHAKIYDRSVASLPMYLTTRGDAGFEYVVSFGVAGWPALLFALAGQADRRAWHTNLLFAGICGGMALYAIYVGGDFWPQWRFLTAILPILALSAQHGLHRLLARRDRLIPASAALVLVVVAASNTGRSIEMRRLSDQGWFVSLQGRLEQAKEIKAIAARYGIADPLYLDPDIGGPSISGLRVVDLAGLTDIHIARFTYYPPFFRDYIFKELRPHIIRTHGPWTRSSKLTKFPEFAQQSAPVRAYEDENGLHGEFVRRDLMAPDRVVQPAAADPPSARQAIADARARRAREREREREGWIEFYSDRGYYARLRAAFADHERNGTLPVDAARLKELYYGLIAANDLAGAERVRARAGLPADTPLALLEGESRRVDLLARRSIARPLDGGSVLQLFMGVSSAPQQDYDLELSLHRVGGAESRTIRHELSPRTSAWRPGSVVRVELWLDVESGEYRIEAALHSRANGQTSCAAPPSACRVDLGTHQVWR